MAKLTEEEQMARQIGQRIRAAREEKDWSQVHLAEEAEVTPAAVSQIEAGLRIPSTPVLRRIAGALAVSTDFLLGRTRSSELADLLENETVRSFFRNYQQLSAEDQKFIQQQIELLQLRKK